MLHNTKIHYICIVFFMVLDLRLTKIGCRDDNLFFFNNLPLSKISEQPKFY